MDNFLFSLAVTVFATFISDRIKAYCFQLNLKQKIEKAMTAIMSFFEK